jgi:hypothetical protein
MMWDVGVAINGKVKSIVDSGFYPTDVMRAVQLGDQVSVFLGLTEPVKVCASAEDAAEFLAAAGADAIAVWPFDWDAISW